MKKIKDKFLPLSRNYINKKMEDTNQRIEMLNSICTRTVDQLLRVNSMLENIQVAMDVEKRHCPICDNEFYYYEPFGAIRRGEAQCPICKSLERQRSLWLWFYESGRIEKWREKGGEALHFAPERVFLKLFHEIWGEGYYPVDINQNMYGVRETVDITNIQFDDKRFDIVICNHVLEHIADEKKALSEIRRVLKDDGEAFIMVPLANIEKTVEKSEYNTSELRIKYYGQADHVRQYGNDFADRLRESGFLVEEIDLIKGRDWSDIRKHGLRTRDKLFICQKTQK